MPCRPRSSTTRLARPITVSDRTSFGGNSSARVRSTPLPDLSWSTSRTILSASARPETRQRSRAAGLSAGPSPASSTRRPRKRALLRREQPHATLQRIGPPAAFREVDGTVADPARASSGGGPSRGASRTTGTPPCSRSPLHTSIQFAPAGGSTSRVVAPDSITLTTSKSGPSRCSSHSCHATGSSGSRATSDAPSVRTRRGSDAEDHRRTG